jgi:hypothetical protein
MWIVKLTAKSGLTGKRSEHLVTIRSNSVEDLLTNDDFRWKVLERLMDKGTLLRVDVDFKMGVNQ